MWGNPILNIPRVMLMVRGLKRAKGQTQRKRPITLEDLRALQWMLNLDTSDQSTVWASTLLGWFFMLRMSEFLDTRGPTPPDDRHPLLVSDIDPLCAGVITHWGDHVDEVVIHISGSKTDWLNQGCIRSHFKVSGGSQNKDVCVVRALTDLYKRYPEKFNNREVVFATWRNGEAIKPPHLTTLLRSAVLKNGADPSKYSIHSLRAGGATALYRATHDIDLVARFGRWKSASISAYLWEIHQMMTGLSDCMVRGGHVLHSATNRTATKKPPSDMTENINDVPKNLPITRKRRQTVGKPTSKGVESDDE